MLEDIEDPSKMMQEAMRQGIKTLGNYTIWFQGYETGYTDRHNEVLELLKEQKEQDDA